MARTRGTSVFALLAAAGALAAAALVVGGKALAAFAAPAPPPLLRGSAAALLSHHSTGAAAELALPGREPHTSPSLVVGGAAVLTTLALALAASRRGAAGRGRGAAARRARVVTVEVENDVPLVLAKGSVAQMDAFMKENATEVCLQNIQRMEDKPGESGIKLCYLEPTDFGPFRSQMRLTIRCDLPESGRCDITILNMEIGSVDKKTGDVTFPGPKEDPGNFKFDTSNILTWKANSTSGLKISNTSKAKSETILPFWFPLPDMLMQSLSSAFVRRIISTGQEKVMEQLEQKFVLWEARQSA